MIPLSKYNYSVPEEYIMLVFAWISHIFMIPVMVLAYKSKEYWMAFITVLAFLSSLMYRTFDTIDGYSMILNQESWHKLSNIGTISCLLMVLVYLMDNQNQDFDIQLNYLAFAVALLTQEGHSWHSEFIFGPLAIGVILAILVMYSRRRLPKYENHNMFIKGLLLMAIGGIFFTASINVSNDYLFIFNSMWRLLTSWGCFYLVQTKRKVEDEISFLDVFADKSHFE